MDFVNIFIDNFSLFYLQPSKYKELKEAFCHPDITWDIKGPANKR